MKILHSEHWGEIPNYIVNDVVSEPREYNVWRADELRAVRERPAVES